MRRRLLFLLLLLASVRPAGAQTPAPSKEADPPLRRWFEFQQFVLTTRYRYVETSADVVTSNQMQYRDQIRGRFNLDAGKRYTINFGAFSGSNFISSWDNLGPGTGDFDGHNQYVKQFFLSATPVTGVEGQLGGLYPNRGENTEWSSWDDDGYLVGERVSVRRPKRFYLDEISVTHGMLGPSTVPNVWRRFEFDNANYTQVLGAKRFNQMVSASLDYTNYASTDALRGAIVVRFKAGAPLSLVRYEQYVRTTSPNNAAGFGLLAERQLSKWLRLGAGYTTIDEKYGGLNADRIQRGRRVVGTATVPIWGPLTVSIFTTHAFEATYAITNKNRFDLLFAWDVLNSLRKTGAF